MNAKNAELQAITDTVNLYVDGLHTGNPELLKKAFHPKAMMYGISSKAVTIVEIEGLYGFVSANEPPSKTGEPHSALSRQFNMMAMRHVLRWWKSLHLAVTIQTISSY